jgi:hypothetical protein
MFSATQAAAGVKHDGARRTGWPGEPSPPHPLEPALDPALWDEWPAWMLPDPDDLVGLDCPPVVEPDAQLLARWAEFDDLVADGTVLLEPAEAWLAAPVATRTSHEDLLAVLASDAPRPVVGEVLARLSEGTVSAAQRIDRIKALAQVINNAHGQLMSQIADLHATRDKQPTFTDEDEIAYAEFLSVEIGLALRMGPKTSSNLVDDALTLTKDLKATHAELLAGRIDLPTARAIIDGTIGLNDEAREKVELICLTRAGTPGGTPAGIRRLAKREAMKADPEVNKAREEIAKESIGASKTEAEDGVGDLVLTLAVKDRAAVWTSLRDHARALKAVPGEKRTMRRLMADVAVDLITKPWLFTNPDTGQDQLVDPRPTPGREHKWNVDVVVNLTTLLGIDDDPALLVGHGNITADIARELAADGIWRRLLTDARGAVVERSTTRYRPTAALADHIEARDRVCQTPGCRKVAAICDKDHRIPYHQGGAPCDCNLWLLCRNHHRCKHSPRWTFTRDADGTVHVTTPTGHTYTEPPPSVWD